MCVISRVVDSLSSDLMKLDQPPPLSQKEIAALRELIKSAKQYDKVTGQPKCESKEKLERLKQLHAEMHQIIEEVLQEHNDGH